MDAHSRKAPLPRGGRGAAENSAAPAAQTPRLLCGRGAGFGNAYADGAAMASAAVADHTESGVSPRGTTINLFDYWVSDRDANDQSNPTNWQNEGVNAGRTLLFGSGMDKIAGIASYNQWTGTAEPYQGCSSLR